MKLRSFLILVVTFGSLMMSLACRMVSSPPSSFLKTSNETPHAVDLAGRALPESSAMQPDKSIILAKDSSDGQWSELKPEAAFDHTKHSTDVLHSLDGKTVTTCVECHHTEQPSAPKGEEYLKRFERNEALSTQQLETSKQPVKSCRACHLQASAEPTDEFPPESVTYPKKTGKQPSGTLTNDNAYHIKCVTCHEDAVKRDSKLKAPQTCGECHIKKS